MKINDIKEQDDGSALLFVEYSEEEFEMFGKFAKDEGKDIDNMKENDIIQFSVLEILKKQIERCKDEK